MVMAAGSTNEPRLSISETKPWSLARLVLPVDAVWPFFHLDRKFMHLGFHIYDVGFQSPNVEAAKPMVYITTLVLIMVVVSLNLMAMMLRNRLRKKYAGSAV